MASETPKPVKRRRVRRQATVYDAVAGRICYEGFLSDPQPSKYRDTASTSTTVIPPEEVLFRRKNAPVRYEEEDIYSADRHLIGDQRLPDSDLLKVIHAYASGFYAAVAIEDREKDFRSLDETALLAIGILLEEAASEALGATDYLEVLESTVQEQRSQLVTGE